MFRTARPKKHTLSSGMSPYSPNKGVPSPFRETCAHPSFQARRECHDVTHVVLGASQAAGSDWAIADFFQLFNLRTFCFAHRGRFACFGRFVWLVSVVSFRPFRSFRFVVSGFRFACFGVSFPEPSLPLWTDKDEGSGNEIEPQHLSKRFVQAG